MPTLLDFKGNPGWILAVATLCLGASVWIDRYPGRGMDFFAGFFLGLAIALSIGYLLLLRVRARSSRT